MCVKKTIMTMKIFDMDQFDHRLNSLTVSGTQKGWELAAGETSLQVAGQGLNVLAEDFPLPVATVKRAALESNLAWMKQFTAHYGIELAPHAKTAMCPQIFRRQLEQGAWGVTLATMHQVKTALDFGVKKVLLANQLVGKQDMKYLMQMLKLHEDVEFYCLVDDARQAQRLAHYAGQAELQRPVNVLIELGFAGRRCGVRNDEQALEFARVIHELSPALALCGVEGYEGAAEGNTLEEKEEEVRRFLRRMVSFARQLVSDSLLHSDKAILTAGGSAFFDLVAEELHQADIGLPTQVILRSGCYVLHDAILYDDLYQSILRRSQVARDLHDLSSALQVWAYVLSTPERGRVVLGLGKRDASYDAGLPAPVGWYRPGEHAEVQGMNSEAKLVEINDQHAMMTLPEGVELRCGDMVVFDISHPCLTVDKWQNLLLVDNDYSVEEVMRTFF